MIDSPRAVSSIIEISSGLIESSRLGSGSGGSLLLNTPTSYLSWQQWHTTVRVLAVVAQAEVHGHGAETQPPAPG